MKSWSWKELKFKLPQIPHLRGGKPDIQRSCDLSEFWIRADRGRFLYSWLFFPASTRDNLHPLETEPLPTFATTQAKKEGKNLLWRPFFLVLWHGSLLPQYYCLPVNYSALPRLEYSIPSQILTQQSWAWHRMSVHVSPSPSEKWTTPHQHHTSMGRADKLFVRKCAREMQHFY